jgi:hypothetical protein
MKIQQWKATTEPCGKGSKIDYYDTNPSGGRDWAFMISTSSEEVVPAPLRLGTALWKSNNGEHYGTCVRALKDSATIQTFHGEGIGSSRCFLLCGLDVPG